MSFIPGDQPTKVVQPSEQPLDLPAPAIAAKWPSILRDVAPGTAVWRDELDASFRAQSRIEGIGVVRAVPDQALGRADGGEGVEGRFDEGDFIR